MTLPPGAGTTDLPEGDPPDRSAPTSAAAPTTDAPRAPPAAAPPRRLRAFLVGLMLAAVLAVLLFVGLGSTSHPSATSGDGVVPIGSVAPDFTLPPVAGGVPVDLFALGKSRHHPVILNFFASWCIPCQQETPLLASTASAEQAKGSVLQFVGVDVGEQLSAALPFVTKAGITYPVGQDADIQVAGTRYGLNGEPQTFFIDESGVVVGHALGPLTKSQLDSWVHRFSGGA